MMYSAMAMDYWQMCLQAQDMEQACQLFLKALDSAKKCLQDSPNDQNVKTLIGIWDDACDGLDGTTSPSAPLPELLDGIITVASDQKQLIALVLCLRATAAYFAAKQAGPEAGAMLIERVTIPNLQEALQIKPNYTIAQERLAQIQSQHINPEMKAIEHYNRGNSLSRQGQLREANQEFRKALEINPHFIEAQDNMAVNHANMGVMLEREKRYDEAIDEARTALQLGFEPATELLERLELQKRSEKAKEPTPSSSLDMEPKKKSFWDMLKGK